MLSRKGAAVDYPMDYRVTYLQNSCGLVDGCIAAFRQYAVDLPQTADPGARPTMV